MGENPPVLVLSLETRRSGDSLKDTTINIRDTGEFVVHLVDEDLGQAMNVCAIDFPSDIDEATQAGLTLVPSARVRPQRIVEAPVAFECEKIGLLQIGPGRQIAIAKVLLMHVRDGLVDRENLYIDIEQYKPIGRLFAGLYTKTRDQFEMRVPDYAEWARGQEPQ
jgi:flavin reductase (DIM6/NTAB) family NADH-FMN oxidoreductase RutF